MFKTMQGKKIPNVSEYIKNYLKNHSKEKIDIIIGSDSQNIRCWTSYATVIVLYHEGHGGHVIYQKEKTLRERVRSTRLMNEVYMSVNLAEELKSNGVPMPKYIDIDINPNEKFKSSEVFNSAVGLVRGMGYECRYKTLGVAATYCADTIARH